MRHIKFFIVALAIFASVDVVKAIEYNSVQQDGSSLSFVFKQMNVPVEGKFQRFTAQLSLDPARPEAGRVLIDIDLNSIDMGNYDGNTEVKGKSWFDTKNGPTAQFVSTGIKALGGNRFEASGKMTMKGRTKDIKVPFAIRQKEAAAQMEGGFIMKRLEWGIGEGVWADTETVADEVEVRFRFFASAKRK